MDTSLNTLTWRALMVRGVVAIGIGILALFWPGLTAITFALVWGIWALVDGGMSILHAFSVDAPAKVRIGWGLLAVLALIAGIFAVLRPGVTVVVLTWMLGIWLIARGIVELLAAFSRSTTTPRWLFVLSALLDGLLGVLFVANPGAGALAVAMFLGSVTIFWGVATLGLGVVLRREVKAADQPTSAVGSA